MFEGDFYNTNELKSIFKIYVSNSLYSKIAHIYYLSLFS